MNSVFLKIYKEDLVDQLVNQFSNEELEELIFAIDDAVDSHYFSTEVASRYQDYLSTLDI